MDTKRRKERQEKKRLASESVTQDKAQSNLTPATDLNKKQKVTGPQVSDKPKTTAATAEPTEKKEGEEKPWENKPVVEDDQDYRWNICENCQ